MNPNTTNPLMRILGSSKALIVLAVVTAAFGAFFAGKAQWDQVESMVKYLVGALILGQSAEDAAKHIAGRGSPVAAHKPTPDETVKP